MKSKGSADRASQNVINACGFTLLELMVATSVLMLMAAMAFQSIDALTRATVSSSKRMSVDNEARLILNRIGQDLTSSLKRKDVDYYFDKQDGNDMFALFSQTSGYYPMGVGGVTPTSPLALVGYRIQNHQIQRLNKALVWNGVDTTVAEQQSGATVAPLVYWPLRITDTWPDVQAGRPDPDYQTVGGQIFRLEFCFLLSDGTKSSDPWLPSSSVPNGQSQTQGLADVRAMIIAVAAMDFQNRKTVSDLATVAEYLPDITGPDIDTLPAQLWEKALAQNNLNIPSSAAAGIRIYQSHFPLEK